MQKMLLILLEMQLFLGHLPFENAQDALKMSRQAAGDFSSSLSKSISDGEQILNSANSSVSSGLTSLEGSAGKINQSLQQALDSAGNVTALNASLLAKNAGNCCLHTSCQ